MKKTYIKPTSDISMMATNNALLTTSPTPGVGDGSAVGDAFDDGDVTYSNDQFVWEEEW